MKSYVLGTDIGTGSTKTVAVDRGGIVLCSSQVYYPTSNPQPGYSEQDPAIILQAFIKAIHETVVKMGYPPVAVSLSSAMHSVLPVSENGDPLSPLILWSDARSNAIAQEIRYSLHGASLYEATGTPIHSMSPLCKIIWIKQNLPEIFGKTFKFISIKEYIWYQLFSEFKIDYSLASATGLFHIEQLEWNPDSLSLAAITDKKLSDPVPTDYIKKGLTDRMSSLLRISADTPFCIGASDGCLANLGTHALDEGTAAITIGTSGAVRIARKQPYRNFSMMSFNYLLDKKTYICGGPINNGGNTVEWLLKKFLLKESVTEKEYGELFKSIEMAPAGCNGLIFLPYIHGERAPLWDQQASGAFLGIRSIHDQLHFLRAVIEGICFALQQIVEAVEDPAHPIGEIHASGGMVHSVIWMQMLADITGKKVCVQHTEDASATGAAYLALLSMGMITDYAQLHKPFDILHPRLEQHQAYQKNYALFQPLYAALRESMHGLYALTNPV